MPISDFGNIRIPEAFQEPVCFVIAAMIILAMTDATLDIAWVRHRWRLVCLASKYVGLVSIILLLIWPSQIGIYGLCIALFHGFADPRLHIASIKRNKTHPILKWVFCFTILAHHAGGAFVVSDMIKPAILGEFSTAGLPPPIILSCVCEIFCWFTDVKILMRTAPKWFMIAHQLTMALQLSAFTCAMILYPQANLCKTTLFGCMIGSFSALCAGSVSFSTSTNESLTGEDGNGASIARVFHKTCPLTEDKGVLPLCSA